MPARASKLWSRSRGRALQLGLAGALALGLTGSAAGAGGDERSDLESKLEKAIAAKDADNARVLLLAASKFGDERAAKLIVADAARLKPLQAHQALIDSMKQIKDEAGVKELIDQALKGPYAEMRFLYVEGLAAQGSPPAVSAALDALDDKDELVAIGSARCARALPAADTVERLIARLEKAEPKPSEGTLARELLGALVSVTGEALTFAIEWRGWWLDHSATWRPRPQPSPTATPAPTPAPAPSGEPTGKYVEVWASLLDRLRKERPEDVHTLEKIKDDDVTVVRGDADGLGGALKNLKIAHKEISPEELSKLKLNPASVLILNCNNRKASYSEVDFAQLREFVDKGGYLFTEDAQLRLLLARAFPGSTSFDKIYTPPRRGEALKVAIVPAAPRHELMRDVFPLTSWDNVNITWAIDGGCETGRLLTPEAVVLVTSPECKKQLENEVVAFAFRWHKGKVVPYQGTHPGTGTEHAPEPEGGCVLHVLPHLRAQKEKDAGDHFAYEQLLVNFVLEKQRMVKRGD